MVIVGAKSNIILPSHLKIGQTALKKTHFHHQLKLTVIDSRWARLLVHFVCFNPAWLFGWCFLDRSGTQRRGRPYALACASLLACAPSSPTTTSPHPKGPSRAWASPPGTRDLLRGRAAASLAGLPRTTSSYCGSTPRPGDAAAMPAFLCWAPRRSLHGKRPGNRAATKPNRVGVHTPIQDIAQGTEPGALACMLLRA